MYLDLRASSGYINEAEKLERNDSKINLHIMLKQAAAKKLRLRVWAYSLGEYLYILSKIGLTLRHRTYILNQTSYLLSDAVLSKRFLFCTKDKKKWVLDYLPSGIGTIPY